jgi:hypothetical protein
VIADRGHLIKDLGYLKTMPEASLRVNITMIATLQKMQKSLDNPVQPSISLTSLDQAYALRNQIWSNSQFK